MNRTEHAASNLRAALKLAWLAGMHLAHAIYPSKWTAHKTWEDLYRRATATRPEE